MKSSALDRIPMDKIARFLWGAALFSLPVTSFRYYPLLGNDTSVRPLALYPLALLLPVLLIQTWRDRLSFPRAGVLVPLTAFLLFTLAASGFGAWLDPLPMRGQEYFGRVIRAWLTVAIGLSFFISAMWMNRNEDDLRFSIKWLLAGLVMNGIWSGVQILALYTPLLSKETISRWQLAFSMRELSVVKRVSGMAFEPAWLAGQIVTIYLPWLFATLLTRVRVTRSKWFELVMLLFAGLLLLTTVSRGGLFTAGAALLLTFLLAGRAEVHSMWNWFRNGFKSRRGMILRIGIMAMVVGAFVGAILFLAQRNYIARMFNTSADSLEEFIIENYAGSRVAYTYSALEVYKESPLAGVGLGASGFYMYDHLPDWSMTTLTEIAEMLAPNSRVYPNPKNMYARLLAETGLIGFALFIIYLFSVLADALRALQGDTPFSRYLGMAALYSWFAILIYNATQDSFATPNIWINFGILAGMTAVAKNKGFSLPSSSLPYGHDVPQGNGQEQELP
jgi:hypothetical protein